MWQSRCALLMLLGAVFANGIPVWFYNTGFQNPAPIGIECSLFTKEYDPNTGHFSYRCNPDTKNIKHSSLPTLVNNIPGNTNSFDRDSPISTMDSAEEALQSDTGSSGGSQHAKVRSYRSLNGGRSGSKNSKRRRPNRPVSTYTRHNRCPTGQIFQSELNICIKYPSAPPLPPRND